MEAPSGDVLPAPTPGPVDLPNGKRRWRRNRVACDSCHTRRVRCDRAFPCSRCLRSEVHCEFTREKRKRGRIARAKMEDEATGATSSSYSRKESNADQKLPPQSASSPPQNSSPESTFRQRSPATNEISLSAPSIVDGSHSATDAQRPARPAPEGNRNNTEEWLSAAQLSPESYDLLGGMNGSNGGDGPWPRLLDVWNPVDLTAHPPPPPPPQSLPASNPSNPPGQPQTPRPRSNLKYPVLEPIMPFLESNLPRRLVCDLLELYFTSAFSTHMHPVCHHIHCYVLRKASFLSLDNPRASSPALLASMLWVAAVDDRAFSLSISPLQRRKICQFLCALTIRLLRPLIHVSFKDQDQAENLNGSQDFAGATAHRPFEGAGDDKGLIGPAGSLDDVVTYIHVASIISSSEQKAASMRWYVIPLVLCRDLVLLIINEIAGGTRLSPWLEN